jgi:molecular chaperone GrpE
MPPSPLPLKEVDDMKEQDEQLSREQMWDDESASAEQGGAKQKVDPMVDPPTDPLADRLADPMSADAATDQSVGAASGGVGESAIADPTELHMLLEDARAKADQTHDQLLRVRAEMENMQRRQAKELENAHKFALDGFVKELLLVRDSLELGYAAAIEPDADVVKLREGTELTLKQLGDVMTKFGVERVYPEGEPFDPAFHQAMSVQPRADVPPNTVTAVIQSGYLLNGRLMRPALVMVSKQG